MGKCLIKLMLCFWWIGIIAGLFQAQQIPSTTLRIMNKHYQSTNHFLFSVYLKNTSSYAFEYSAAQYFFNFNKDILNTSTGNFTFIRSELKPNTLPIQPTIDTTTNPWQLYSWFQHPFPRQGYGTVIEAGDSVLIAEYQLSCSASRFAHISPNIQWRSPISGNPFTKMLACINSLYVEIEGNTTFFNDDPDPLPPEIKWLTDILAVSSWDSPALITFGQASKATVGLDAMYGEDSLGSPGSNIFDVRFLLPTIPVLSSFRDFRPSDSTECRWTVSIHVPNNQFPVTFKWNPHTLPAGFFILHDTITGNLVKKDLKSDSILVITANDPLIYYIDRRQSGCISFPVEEEWNLVSIPLLPYDSTLQTIFPQATSSFFGYSNGYTNLISASPEKGFWVRFSVPCTTTVCGNLKTNFRLPVREGWNLMGVLENNIPVNGIITDPPNSIQSQVYGWHQGYNATTTMLPGKGYWIRMKQDAFLMLDTSVHIITAGRKSIPTFSSELTIRDNSGNQSILYLTSNNIDLNEAKLPPVPPLPIFDARFVNDCLIENFSNEVKFRIQSEHYPIRIIYSGRDAWLADAISGNMINRKISDGEEITINNKQLVQFFIRPLLKQIDFSLEQNFPNPFNPSTTIKYQIGKRSLVRITLFNSIGSELATLVNVEQSSGKYSLKIDAREFGLSSGIYYYTIRAGEFFSGRKMLLLK